MNLYEFEGKSLFRRYGIPVPASCLVEAADQARPMQLPCVLKAQVLTGGRGKAGGVKICRNEAEYRNYAEEILSMTIKGHPVHALLCEEAVHPEQELYLSITLQGVAQPTLIFCAAGGMEIEEVARTAPEKILRLEIDPFTGLKQYQLRQITAMVDSVEPAELIALVRNVERAFRETQALLVEINPLGVVNGALVAMDAKYVLDDHAPQSAEDCAVFREGRKRLPHWQEPPEEKTTITYVPLEGGDIGLISDGAGTGMLTLDLLHDAGGAVASFCELGGTTPPEVMYRALEYTLTRKTGIRAVIVVLIGGFNRMDDMANGITRYLREHPTNIPVFTRMCGTNEEEGCRIMAEAGLETSTDLADTVRRTVAATKEER